MAERATLLSVEPPAPDSEEVAANAPVRRDVKVTISCALRVLKSIGATPGRPAPPTEATRRLAKLVQKYRSGD